MVNHPVADFCAPFEYRLLLGGAMWIEKTRQMASSSNQVDYQRIARNRSWTTSTNRSG